MKPIEFEQMTGTAAKDQPEYMPLPMYRDNEQVISCWELNERERLVVLATGKIWMRLTHPANALITPSLLEVQSPFKTDPPPNILDAIKVLTDAGFTVGMLK